MAIAITEQWTCDLCGESTGIVTKHTPPEGWIRLATENQFMGSRLRDKCLCKSFLITIRAALPQEKKLRWEP